jgi:hypothetical protein
MTMGMSLRRSILGRLFVTAGDSTEGTLEGTVRRCGLCKYTEYGTTLGIQLSGRSCQFSTRYS